MTIAEGELAGQNIDTSICFKAKDGSWMTRTIENMQEVFGMHGANPFWMQFENPDNAADARERNLTDKKFNIVVEAEEFNGKTTAKVKWINPLGSSGGWTPKPVDRKSILAKYGSLFRAMGGSAPTKTATPPPAKKSTPPPPQTGPTATMEEAWEECCKAHNMEEQNSTSAWQTEMAQMFPGKTNSDLTPHDWGRLKEKFADNVPA
jgi:hypothetical protein